MQSIAIFSLFIWDLIACLPKLWNETLGLQLRVNHINLEVEKKHKHLLTVSFLHYAFNCVDLSPCTASVLKSWTGMNAFYLYVRLA